MLLFNGCCDFIKKGEDALSKKDYEQTNNWVQKAQSIISEFRCTLNPKYEIAKQLNPLYKYSYTCLMEGNMNSDITKIKFFWVQYVAVLLPVAGIFYFIMQFVFRNYIVNTINSNDIGVKKKKIL